MSQGILHNAFGDTQKRIYLMMVVISFGLSFVTNMKGKQEARMSGGGFISVEVEITNKSTLNTPSLYFLYKGKRYSTSGGVSTEGFRQAIVGETFVLEYNEEYDIFRDPNKIYSSTLSYFLSIVFFLVGLYSLIGLFYVLFFSPKKEKDE